mgnify:CR=1 FL=1
MVERHYFKAVASKTLAHVVHLYYRARHSFSKKMDFGLWPLCSLNFVLLYFVFEVGVRR